MHEIVVNLHMHTRYSDGSGSHRDIARAALRQRIDAVIVTDHNVHVRGIQGYYEEQGRRVLVLIGEEIHDRLRQPQKNHLLVFGAGRELAELADNTATLLREASRSGGLAFLAHPIDPAAPAFGEADLSWDSLPQGAFAGIELWNGLSELKAHIPTRLHGLLFAFMPALAAHGPLPEALDLWDHLLGRRVVIAIGGSDAHALPMRMGILRRWIFPYDYHFRAINTHVLLEEPLKGDADHDSAAIMASLRRGRCFIGYDLMGATKGFRFMARRTVEEVEMGGRVRFHPDLTLIASAPGVCELQILRNGRSVAQASHRHSLEHSVSEPGVYRVEAHRRYWGRRRTWVLSNPIFVE